MRFDVHPPRSFCVEKSVRKPCAIEMQKVSQFADTFVVAFNKTIRGKSRGICHVALPATSTIVSSVRTLFYSAMQYSALQQHHYPTTAKATIHTLCAIRSSIEPTDTHPLALDYE